MRKLKAYFSFDARILKDGKAVADLRVQFERYVNAAHLDERLAGRLGGYFRGAISSPMARPGERYRIEIRSGGAYLIDSLARKTGMGTKIFP